MTVEQRGAGDGFPLRSKPPLTHTLGGRASPAKEREPMTVVTIKEKVLKCVKTLSQNEREIIQNDINERTIAHKLAEYLQHEFSDLDVDVEYNRNLEIGIREPKYVSLIKDEFRHVYNKAKTNDENLMPFMEQVTAYPDIIVHQRGNNNKNTLIIEVKKSNNKSDWQIDEKKLEAFTRMKEDDGYGYTLGMHLVIYISARWKEPTYEWYQNGTKEQ